MTRALASYATEKEKYETAAEDQALLRLLKIAEQRFEVSPCYIMAGEDRF